MSESLEYQLDNENFIDYYKILDIDVFAEPEEIKKQFDKMAKLYHPDRPGGNSEIFMRISKAYEVLCKKKTKSAYDLYYFKHTSGEIALDTDHWGLKTNFNLIQSEINSRPLDLNREIEEKKFLKELEEDREKFKEIALKCVQENGMTHQELTRNHEYERGLHDVENSDEKIKEILLTNPDIKPDDLLNYVKFLGGFNNSGMYSSTEIIPLNLESNTDDFEYESWSAPESQIVSKNVYDENIILNEIENYSCIEKPNEDDKENVVSTLNIEDFKKWKDERENETKKIENVDIDMFLKKRQNELENMNYFVENKIINNLETRSKIGTFLKKNTKNKLKIDEEDILATVESNRVFTTKINNVKHR